MPLVFLLLLAGIILVTVTSYTTLGWVLIAIALVLVVLALLFVRKLFKLFRNF